MFRDAARNLERRSIECFGLGHAGDDPQLARLGRIEHAAREHQLYRNPRTGDARQQVAHADVAARKPGLDDDVAEACPARSEAVHEAQ